MNPAEACMCFKISLKIEVEAEVDPSQEFIVGDYLVATERGWGVWMEIL
jgi:hypothetical protein